MNRQTFHLDAVAHGSDRRNAQTLRMTLGFASGPLETSVTVCGEGTLADLVPLARTLADEVVRRGVAASNRQGKPAACKKGCGSCCRYFVPLSIPEVLRIGQELEALSPQRRRQVQRDMVTAGNRMLQSPPPSLADEYEENPAAGRAKLQTISDWYYSLHIDCPMLSAESCTHYAQRPLACREYIALCGAAAGDTLCPGASKLELSVSVLEALGQAAAELEGLPMESVALPIALHWLKSNAQRANRTWPMKELATRLFDVLNRMIIQRSAAA